MMEDLTDGTGQRVTGYDGQQSWTFSGDGPVLVSDDPQAFRRVVPTGKQELPFFNLHDALISLQEGYQIELSEEETNGTRYLRAYEKTKGVRGPREMHIWFDSESGIVQQLRLIPPGARFRDGPRRILLELVDQEALPTDFFSHTYHHEPDRPVKTEWNRGDR